MRRQTRWFTAAAAGALALFALGRGVPLRESPGPAQRVVSYYKALGASSERMGAWEKLLYSIALAGAPAGASAAGAGARPQAVDQSPTAF